MVSPGTVNDDDHGDANAEPAAPPLDETQDTSPRVIADPPLLTGAARATATWPFPRVTPVMFGAPGTAAGMIDDDAAELAPAPTAFEAVAVHV